MTKKSKTLLWILGGVAVVGGGLLYFAKKPGLKQMPLPPALPIGTPINLTLSPGTMSAVPLSVAAKGTISFYAPTGSTLGVLNWSPADILAPASDATYDVVAAKVGSATVTATFTDPKGITQTSTIPVTVTV